jgi:hypothetical protein
MNLHQNKIKPEEVSLQLNLQICLPLVIPIQYVVIPTAVTWELHVKSPGTSLLLYYRAILIHSFSSIQNKILNFHSIFLSCVCNDISVDLFNKITEITQALDDLK